MNIQLVWLKKYSNFHHLIECHMEHGSSLKDANATAQHASQLYECMARQGQLGAAKGSAPPVLGKGNGIYHAVEMVTREHTGVGGHPAPPVSGQGMWPYQASDSFTVKENTESFSASPYPSKGRSNHSRSKISKELRCRPENPQSNNGKCEYL
ncbi:hypothetical protein Scep_004274 [Stephania cephalantha]|uniref:Uncharacterized protein n=1 Tax=Stephania cephalantha TaxID=152367 RepID=A0AAP0KT20_9MAGN